jgi:hypothetical protein
MLVFKVTHPPTMSTCIREFKPIHMFADRLIFMPDVSDIGPADPSDSVAVPLTAVVMPLNPNEPLAKMFTVPPLRLNAPGVSKDMPPLACIAS